MNDLPEAPVSQTIKLSYKGCEILLTQRDLKEKMLPYLEQAINVIDGALKMGFEPPPTRGFAKKEVVYADHPCPSCGKRVVIAETSKGKMEKCETQSYNFQTKTASGCAYVKWL